MEKYILHMQAHHILQYMENQKTYIYFSNIQQYLTIKKLEIKY